MHPLKIIGPAVLPLLFACLGCTGREENAAAPKNLLFVVFDTTRADHLGAFGYRKRPTSPRVDELAAGGLLIERAYAQSSLTPVSAGSFLTGTMPYRHGVRSLFNIGEESLNTPSPALFDLLRTAGRRTAGFVSAKPMGKHYGLDLGFELYDDDLDTTRATYGIERFLDAPQRPGDATTDLALEWLDEHGTQPFAVMVHLFDAHDTSFLPPPSFLQEHLSFAMPQGVGRRADGYMPASLEQALELYDAEIRFCDDQLGRLLDKLEELGVRDETCIVLLADHGESFGEHGYFTHGWLSEEQLRVPLVINSPGLSPASRLQVRVRLVDLFPTLAQLFDLPLPADLDGESFLELPRQSPLDDRDVYAEVHHAPGDPRGREAQMYTVLRGVWKYIHHPETGKHELYQLRRDPLETQNRFSARPKIATRLLKELLRCGALGGAGVVLDGLSEQQIRELQALGYLGEVKTGAPK